MQKKLHWRSTFGEIEVVEQTFLNLDKKIRIRPFSTSAEVQCRGYSMRLQRVLTDFGADEAFGTAAKKVREHYGIDVPASTTRLKVEKHAKRMQKNEHR